MTKEEILKEFENINFVYNNCSKHDTLKRMLDELTETVLDKIRAEIESLEEGITSYHNDRPWIFKDEALGIIDKYKAESEER